MYAQSKDTSTWVAEVESLSSRKYTYRIGGNKFKKDNSHGHILVPATEQQIAHLKACIAANKYIPYTEEMLKPFYEIY